jgi:poly(3-hydroxybutyrate) depolymerase
MDSTLVLLSLAIASPLSSVDALRDHLALPPTDRPAMAETSFAHSPLTRDEAEEATALLWAEHAERIRNEASEAWADGRITLGDDTMRFLVRRYGSAPYGQRSLWISLHGGGGAPPAVNDRQWENQIRIYRPDEGIYVAPRALQDTWDLWHEPRIDRFIARMIEIAIAIEGVSPDRIYLLGYSAGGDGLYRLGPRLADRLAAASMMAGHPGDADPRSLRNLPFAIQVGADDTPYERNLRAREWGERLAELHSEDPGGYPHLVRIHEGLGHWMQLRDAFVLEWMARHRREAWPQRIVWHQHGVTHPRFYWLGVDGNDRRPRTTIVATRRVGSDGQRIEIVEADVEAVTVWLHDALVDLDEPVTIAVDGRTLFAGTVERTIATLVESLDERGDPRLMAPARVRVTLTAD